MKKLLVVDDSIDIGNLVKMGLQNYFVHQALTLSDAEKELKKTQYDLLLIDVSLPDGSGFDLCQHLNGDLVYEKVPKILLTAKGEIADKVYGFICGAHDYITKPFHQQELKARIDRYLSEKSAKNRDELILAGFSFEASFQKCSITDEKGKRDLRLTPTEFRLFLTLAKSEGQLLSRSFLERAAWGSRGTTIQARGIDTHITHLRKKLGTYGSMIVAVYGQGYCFKS